MANDKHLSPQARAWRKFKTNRRALICVWVLGILYALALGADVLVPYHYSDEDRDYSFSPPTKIEFIDQGRIVWPFVYGQVMSMDDMHRTVFKPDGKKYPLRLLNGGKLFRVDAPGKIFLCGADARGRDLFSRIIYGARISLTIGLLGVGISFVLGLLIGAVAGFYGGWVDALIMRVCEMFMMVPSFYLMLALRAAVPSHFNSQQIYLSVVVILAFIGWASLARIIRGMTLSLKERDYVLAAKSLGLSDAAIIFRHILPHTLSYSLSALMLSVPSYMLAETGLSVLGLGIEDPVPSWGNLLSDAMGIVPVHFAPWILIPGLFIFITIMSFNIIGDALSDAWNVSK